MESRSELITVYRGTILKRPEGELLVGTFPLGERYQRKNDGQKDTRRGIHTYSAENNI